MEAMDPVVQDILSVAVAEFAEHGLAGARVDAIAARTSTSKRMLYYHFGSKEGLYAAALAHAYARVRSDQAMPPVDALAPMEALRAYVGYVFDIHAAHPEFVRLVMGENLLGGRFVRAAQPIRQVNVLGLKKLENILQRGQAEGTMRRDVRLLDVYANVVGLSFHFVSNRSTFSAIFEQAQDPVQVQQARRRCIVETIERQVMQLPVRASAVQRRLRNRVLTR
jgi:AcrR family transcriptional regulator